MTLKCAICLSKRSPHRTGERLRDFSASLKALGLAGPAAHPSCLTLLVNTRTRMAHKSGRPAARLSASASQKLAVLATLSTPNSKDPSK